ncbi:MAG: hypothetical protein AAFU54_08875 [Chloroflexota bacterium]
MTDLMLAMSQIAAAWLVYGLLLTGLGSLVQRAWGTRPAKCSLDWIVAFWVGWAVCIALLQLWHLAFPVNRWAFAVVGASGAVGLAVNWRDAASMLWHIVRHRYLLLLLTLSVALLFANLATRAPAHYDYYLYYEKTILWLENYRIVPGIGNLHGPLALNHASFLFAALANAAPFPGHGNHIAGSVLVLALWSLPLRGLSQLLRGERTTAVFFAVLTIPFIMWAATWNDYLHSPSADFAVMALGMVLLLLVLLLFEDSTELHDRRYTLVAITVLAAAGVATKLSFVVFALVLLLLMACVAWGDLRGRVIAAVVIIVAVFGGGWLVRGYLMSGYPAYPVATGGLPFGWQMPCNIVTTEATVLLNWSRIPFIPAANVPPFPGWVQPWFTRTWAVHRYMYVLLVVSIVMVGLRTLIRKPWPRTWLIPLCLLFPLIFWFATTPEPRFAAGTWWALTLTVTALVAVPVAHWRGRVAVVSILCMVTLLYALTAGSIRLRTSGGLLQPRPVSVVPFTTDSGLLVFIPANLYTLEPGSDHCTGAPLLCTPSPNPALALIEPANLQRGFQMNVPRSCGSS